MIRITIWSIDKLMALKAGLGSVHPLIVRLVVCNIWFGFINGIDGTNADLFEENIKISTGRENIPEKSRHKGL